MNLTHILTDQDILHRMQLVATLSPNQPCFACEKPLADRSHHRLQTTGASGHLVGVQLCGGCYRTLRRAAYDHIVDANKMVNRPHMAPLTEKERAIPAPVQLGTRFAPREPVAPAPQRTDLFQEEPDVL